MNIGSLLPSHARHRPNHTAVVFEDCRLNFREFNARVNRLGNALSRLGVKKGDKIATILPNCTALWETYWAVAKIGAVVVPLSPLLRERALAALIRDSDSATVIAAPDFAEPLATVMQELSCVADDRIILVGASGAPGLRSYDDLTDGASVAEPPKTEITDDD